jgi:hypothetical protein
MNRAPIPTDLRRRGIQVPPPGAPRFVDTLDPRNPGPFPAPAPDPGGWSSFGSDCNADRVQLAGGLFNQLLVHPEITPFEQLYRRLPEEGMFVPRLSPERPFAFELGAFRPPDGFDLLLFTLRPDIYRFSGIAAGSTVPVERRRFSTQLGFDLTIDQRHHGTTLFQLDPIAIQVASEAFTPAVFPQTAGEGLNGIPNPRFNISAASSFGSSSGPGTSLLPQRPQRYGPLAMPFTLYVKNGQTVQVRCVVFRPLQDPIAFIEYDIAGFLLPELWVNTMMECLKPLSNASRGPGSLGGGPR